MAQDFDDNKTEAPTPRRRESAREEGQVIFSPDLTAGVLLFAVSIAAWLLGAMWVRSLGFTIADQLRGIHQPQWSLSHAMLSVRWLAGQLLFVAGGIAAGAWALNAFTAGLQAGGGIYTKPLSPDPNRMNPVKGWERLWSADSLMKGVLAPLKLVTTLLAAGVYVWIFQDQIVTASAGNLVTSLSVAGRLVGQLMLILSGIMLLFGGLDFAFKRYRHEQKLKMTREEVKQEQKEDQGDMQVKQRMRMFAQESRKRKALKDVATATAVITNPTHFAVAIRYESGEFGAPTVVAKGADGFARQIIAAAKKNGVPVLERKPVARALYALTEIGQEIPFEMYRAVAEVLAEVYRRKQMA